MDQEYISLRNLYLPQNIEVVFVLESPPLGHGYFYNPGGRVSEVLFRAYMKLLNINPSTKEEGLIELKKRGWLLINPIYQTVNKLPDKQADELILQNYKSFLLDLQELTKSNRSVPIILVKSNILRLLEKPLISDRFNVINNGKLIPFPLHYHAERFHKDVMELLLKSGV